MDTRDRDNAVNFDEAEAGYTGRDVDGLPHMVVEDCEEMYKLLDFLEQELQNPPGRRLMGPNVDVERCIDIVQNIRENLPSAIQNAQRTLDERERILRNAERAAADIKKQGRIQADGDIASAQATIAEASKQAQNIVDDAQRQADNILAEAKERADALVAKSEILRRAETEADDIVNRANAEANERRLQINNYVRNILDGLEADLTDSINALQTTRKNLGVNR